MASVEVLVTPSPFANLAPLYEVDLDADALLIVPTSNQPFAPWEDPYQVNGINGAHKKTTHAAAPASRPGLRIKVSSKHLALASRVFRNKLQFGSTKATRQADGRVHLKLAEGFDPKAVSIVVNAVHSRGSQVPKAVDLETLAQIAVVVDRLQLLDAVDVYADRWISKLEGRIQDIYNRDLVLWIYISHVFRRSDIFKAVSKTAAAQAQGPIQTLNLPIREKIINHIDTERQSLLSRTISTLHQTLDDLTTTTSPCTAHHCDSLLLGELVKALAKQKLLWPQPAKPYAGVSFAALVKSVGAAVSVHRQTQRREEGDGWFLKGVNGVGVAKEGGTPGWGVVGGLFPLTPVTSPRLGFGGGGFRSGGHGCDVDAVVARLNGLGALREGVEGLALESELGYQLY
ncbi:hypothetical protein C8A05DRAFT_32711 [Staphylotrichum tortipilum]|uniref:BTB domain-containing protein n=1 Tax=Staphylotrichum tortipilum TaxID=2831512 RepID=A0AAN6MMC0_9PEZI|nr:hypothetical protein C8A05DRAFT_32711 [Staphylotrichum longicolle]